MRPALVVLALAATLAALTLAGPTAARPACTPGTQSSGGVNYRTFCGGAKATLHFGGKTYTFTGGSCDSTSSAFTINIGTITLPPGKPKHRYFGITVFTSHDGTFQNQAVSWQFPNGAHNSLFHAKIVLKGGRKKGTFSGTSLADQKPGSGTFSCT